MVMVMVMVMVMDMVMVMVTVMVMVVVVVMVMITRRRLMPNFVNSIFLQITCLSFDGLSFELSSIGNHIMLLEMAALCYLRGLCLPMFESISAQAMTKMPIMKPSKTPLDLIPKTFSIVLVRNRSALASVRMTNVRMMFADRSSLLSFALTFEAWCRSNSAKVYFISVCRLLLFC